MKAPFEKITARGNDTIQIVVTTSCDLYSCSNCTQLLPFRKDYLHMSVECFREAVRSLKDWPGIVGVFGGNPCSHPKFAELMEVLVEEIPDQRRRGLWTNNLLKHGDLVRQVFYPHGRFNLNAHANPKAAAEMDRHLPGKLIEASRTRQAWHSPVLVDRRDYAMGEAEWVDLREKCDINRNWSAAILERDGRPYAYFCEVAGSIDGVRGENNGIPAEPGWWKWPMERFASQVGKCCDRGCGVPLKLKGHLDREDTYDISPSWKGVAIQRKKTQVVAEHVLAELPSGDKPKELTDYMRVRTA